jgi:hypothetical protein
MGRKTSANGGFSKQSVGSTFVGTTHPVKRLVAVYFESSGVGTPYGRRNEPLNAKLKSDPSHSIREEAKRTLDEVRRRYGIHASDPQVHPHLAGPFRVPTEPAAPARSTLRPGLCGSKAPAAPAEPVQSNPPLKSGWARHPIRANGSASDDKSFHFLIRIAECALILLCEVTADSEADARHQVKQIPNLLEWREISGEEYVSLARSFGERSF